VADGVAIAADAQERYEKAAASAKFAREAWELDGGHFTIEHPNGVEGIHPLLKVVLDCEKHADAMMKSLSHKQARAGRPAGSQSAPDRRRSSAKLKVVNS
jgi:hypothetical protein